MKNLDDNDKRILEMLLEDSRRPYHEIAEDPKVNLSESSVRKRVKKLQEERVIEKFTIKELLREAQVLPQCEEVYFLAGECGVLVKVNVPEIIELDALIESFRARADVKSVERVCVVLRPIKVSQSEGRIL
jgi:DNA-binding Lrp family transcriptional regulator